MPPRAWLLYPFDSIRILILMILRSSFSLKLLFIERNMCWLLLPCLTSPSISCSRLIFGTCGSGSTHTDFLFCDVTQPMNGHNVVFIYFVTSYSEWTCSYGPWEYFKINEIAVFKVHQISTLGQPDELQSARNRFDTEFAIKLDQRGNCL